MKTSGNTMKLVLAIILLVALAAVVTMQFSKLFKKPADTAAPKPTKTAQEQASAPDKAGTKAPAAPATPATEAAKPNAPATPAEGGKAAPAGVTTPPTPPATAGSATPPAKPQAAKQGTVAPAKPEAPPKAPDAGKPAAGTPAPPPAQPAKELPKISFMNEKVDKAFTNSRFFTVNTVVPSGNPFMPLALPVPPRPATGAAKQLNGFSQSLPVPPSGKVGEIPILPMPNEILGEPIRVTLLGISQSGDTATALFSVGSDKSAVTIMAHPGWLIGNDYVFVGAENGKARVFDRKTNRVIQLATGETI
jgi:hypothetical protein